MVVEYRKDDGKGQLIVFSTERGKRPVVYGEKKPACPFCKGNEGLTPPTTFVLPEEKDWKVRCFRNLFAIVKPEGQFKAGAFPAAGYGDHEIVVETDNHTEFFQNLEEEQLMLVLKAYKHRLAELALTKGIKYVLLFKNHGRAAGASIEHEHAQVIALPFVPPLVASEAEHAAKFARETGECYHCMLLEGEAKRNKVVQNDSFVAFCPSFARFPMEFWIMPRKHRRSLLELSSAEGRDLMLILRDMIARLYANSSDYVVAFHNAPDGSDMHFHIEVYPRTSVWGGVELGGGLIVNSKDEKQALEALRKRLHGTP